jgi:hypothetical protein
MAFSVLLSIAPTWKELLSFPLSKQIDFLPVVPVRDYSNSSGLLDVIKETLMDAIESGKKERCPVESHKTPGWKAVRKPHWAQSA